MASENLVIRLVVLSQDAGAIIGKEGRTIRSFRDESGANISISGTAGVERILTISGSTNRIKTACRLIAEKLEEMANPSGDGRHIAPVTLRLLVPNSQCGPLIGKGGCKIKEIREASGATITIPSETLPGCTERAVTVSGSPDAISQCVYHIADVMLEFPARQNNVQFDPQGMGIPGGMGLQQPSAMSGQPPWSGQLSFSGLSRQTEQKIQLPSSMIGSLIGEGDCHINEIRQFSGATIEIAEKEGDSRRSEVTISGTPDAVSSATFLINARIQAGRSAAPRPSMD